MREIKFRAYDEESKKMYQITDVNFSDYVANGICYGDWKDFSINNLLQYTGLKDKNGVEIYEGDIVKAIWSKDCDEYIANEQWIGDVFFNYGSFDINGEWCVALNCFNGTFEVIGNIYENKELLQ